MARLPRDTMTRGRVPGPDHGPVFQVGDVADSVKTVFIFHCPQTQASRVAGPASRSPVSRYAASAVSLAIFVTVRLDWAT